MTCKTCFDDKGWFKKLVDGYKIWRLIRRMEKGDKK